MPALGSSFGRRHLTAQIDQAIKDHSTVATSKSMSTLIGSGSPSSSRGGRLSLTVSQSLLSVQTISLATSSGNTSFGPCVPRADVGRDRAGGHPGDRHGRPCDSYSPLLAGVAGQAVALTTLVLLFLAVLPLWIAISAIATQVSLNLLRLGPRNRLCPAVSLSLNTGRYRFRHHPFPRSRFNRVETLSIPWQTN